MMDLLAVNSDLRAFGAFFARRSSNPQPRLRLAAHLADTMPELSVPADPICAGLSFEGMPYKEMPSCGRVIWLQLAQS